MVTGGEQSIGQHSHPVSNQRETGRVFPPLFLPKPTGVCHQTERLFHFALAPGGMAGRDLSVGSSSISSYVWAFGANPSELRCSTHSQDHTHPASREGEPQMLGRHLISTETFTIKF